MNRYILVFLCFFYVNSFSQNNSIFQIDLFNLNYSSTFFNSDTILGVPFFTDHNVHFLTKNSLNKFSVFEKNNIIIDFSQFVEDGNNLAFNFLSENNLLFFGFPKANSHYSFGFKYSSYFDLNLSNQLINLFWNGNNQYSDNIVSFRENYISLIQFSSLFFQYSSDFSDNFRIGARVSLLHGVNFFNLEKGNFSLQSLSGSITPFSSFIHTDIFYQSSRANFFGFSNPGLSVNLGVKYNFNKWKFLADFQNLGFIFWHKSNSQYQSEGSYFFDGVGYTMDQILSEEINNTLDTLEDVFALNRVSEKSFFSKLPTRFNLQASYSYQPSLDFFIEYFAVQDNLSGYTHNTFFGLSKIFNKKTGFKVAYNFNNYSFNNIQFAISRKFKNILVYVNTNNILTVFDFHESNYLNLQAGIYYFL